MTYSSIGLISLLVLVIINHDVLRRSTTNIAAPSQIAYRHFLFAVMGYFITDILWGILDEHSMRTLLYADGVLYYIAMAYAVLLWTRYVIIYINEKNVFSSVLHFAGQVFFVTEIIFLAVNFFKPCIFSLDESGGYHPHFMRFFMLVIQVMLFLTAAVYSLILSAGADQRIKHRYRMIGVFGIEMIALISIQAFYPLLPLYSIGLLLGTCLLHTFVLEDEKAEFADKMAELFRREEEQKKELGSARQMVYTDPLTGVKSKHAYLEAVKRIENGISNGSISEFGVVVCDLNGLKKINDTLGHEEGDKYIRSGSSLICKCFSHSPVFRIGGDEFAVLLEGDDYHNRHTLIYDLENLVENNLASGNVVVSTGLDTFSPDSDPDFSAVFERADKKMYERKRYLKALTV